MWEICLCFGLWIIVKTTFILRLYLTSAITKSCDFNKNRILIFLDKKSVPKY